MTPDARPAHRVLLVREGDVRASGSGCCGRPGSETVGSRTAHAGTEEPYARSREAAERDVAGDRHGPVRPGRR